MRLFERIRHHLPKAPTDRNYYRPSDETSEARLAATRALAEWAAKPHTQEEVDALNARMRDANAG